MSDKPSRSSSTIRSELSKDLPIMDCGETGESLSEIVSVIDSLKQEVQAQRFVNIQKIIEENRQKLSRATLRSERRNDTHSDTNNCDVLLIKRQKDAVNMQTGLDSGENDLSDEEENTSVLLGVNVPVKNSVRPIRLPEVKRLPPYTTWVFLDRNRRMPEEQSVVGRRRIYYNPTGGEALICSDSEEEVIEKEENKKEFARSEDYILRMAAQQVGLSDTVLELLGQCFSKKPCDVKARYEILSGEGNAKTGLKNEDTAETSVNANPYLNKDLEGALDSFDNLFCRRCYVFYCRLHGCSQDLIFPTEKQNPWIAPEMGKKPCGPNCYLLAKKTESIAEVESLQCDDSDGKPHTTSDDASVQVSPGRKAIGSSKRKGKYGQSDNASSNTRNTSYICDSDSTPGKDNNSIDEPCIQLSSKPNGKSEVRKRKSKQAAAPILVAIQKKQKSSVKQDSDSVTSEGNVSRDMKLRPRTRKKGGDNGPSFRRKVNSSAAAESKKSMSPVETYNVLNYESGCDSFNVPANSQDACDVSRKEEVADESPGKQVPNIDKSWKALEKSLYEKGLEIFGRNGCFIARNLLNGLKTCTEVNEYMTHLDNELLAQGGNNGTSFNSDELPSNDVTRRSRFIRRRGRVRRLKYTWKSTGYHSIRKRITERKDQPCRQFNSCGCPTSCGKQCSCLLNGTCCEKYCGCPKTCKNRFRGCHCAKSQCRSRQCPCFAADRECDPDVCRKCWVSCGDGTLGTPNQRGDNYECRNMKVLLKQQQRVLLGRSDVSGWGAFLKNSVAKHEYLGEYTGELISHREADKRGKIYDRENSSFLFNLNDQFVLDAYRKGDKLKFANHSPNPNCYAKVIMVGGDHRVGIFAKERINGGEELFYDYRYEPDRAPAWAKKPEAPGSKKDDAWPSSGRAKKLA